MTSGQTASDDEAKLDEAIQEIVRISGRWYGILLGDYKNNARLAAALIGIVSLMAAFMIIVSAFNFSNVSPLSLPAFLGLVAVGALAGMATYVLSLRKKPRFSEVSDLVGKIGAGRDQYVLENAIMLTDRIYELMPEMKRKRFADAATGGVLGYFLAGYVINQLTAPLGTNPLQYVMSYLLPLVFGFAVYAYLKRRAKRIYDSEVSRWEVLRHDFEASKDRFLGSL
jgi:peptidoglycan/LPS O-acetylase OafA/YrhL